MARYMKYLIVGLFFITFLFQHLTTAAQQLKKQDLPKKKPAKQLVVKQSSIAKSRLQYFVIRSLHNTYGYDIYADGNLCIHQSNIPGQNGLEGFTDTSKAGTVARLVIQKIKMGKMPPTITNSELIKLAVIPKK